jgi:hypothetical protein
MSEINKQRLPTPADLIILDWLQKGQSINNAEAITRFGNACLRDAIWRLGNAGYIIFRDWVYYINGSGKEKKYKRYFMTKPEIIPNGKITEVTYKPKTQTAIDHANAILKQTAKSAQVDLFQNAQNDSKEPHY